MLTRLASTLLVLAVLVFGGACQRGAPPGESAPPERTQAAREALTPGAGSVGDCNGNPSRCTMVMLEAGDKYAVALESDGTVWAWGSNNAGQLGDGTTMRRTTPVQVKGSGGTGTLSGIVAVAAADLHTIALRADGTVWAWGYNGEGQLGDGSTTNQTAPIQVSTLSDIVAVSAGDRYSVALGSDGKVWAWGNNAYGQLGDGTTANQSTPTQVKGDGGVGTLGDVVAVAAGPNHTVALKSDGTVWTWGRNADGQLGDGTATNQSAPVQVIDPGGTGTLSGVVAVAAGPNHTVALKSDGTVWAWGGNSAGQLGDGTVVSKTTPVQATGRRRPRRYRRQARAGWGR